MTAFLRNDLWSKPYIYRAEELAATTDKDSSFKIKTRANFGAAAVLGTAQTIAYAVPTAFLFIGHLAAKAAGAVGDFKLARKVSSQYQEFSEKLWGSAVATAIAAASAATSTGVSQSAQDWLINQYGGNWEDFKKTQLGILKNRIDTIRASKIASTIEEERYVVGSKLYFDNLTEGVVKKVQKMIGEADKKINQRGISDTEKCEHMRQAMLHVNRMVEKSRAEVGRLPMTYLELADHKIEEAVKLKGKALKFLDKQAGRVMSVEKLRQPKKFDAQTYVEKVNKYRGVVNTDFDKKIERLQQHAKAVRDVWAANVEVRRKNERDIQSQIKSCERWRFWLGWTFDEDMAKDYNNHIQNLHQQKNDQLAVRRQAIMGVRNSVFKELEWQHLSYQKEFCNYVGPRGYTTGNWLIGGAKIIRELDSFAKPTLTQRWYRSWAKPVVDRAPNYISKRVEDLFDPDVGTFNKNEWRVTQWLDKYF